MNSTTFSKKDKRLIDTCSILIEREDCPYLADKIILELSNKSFFEGVELLGDDHKKELQTITATEKVSKHQWDSTILYYLNNIEGTEKEKAVRDGLRQQRRRRRKSFMQIEVKTATKNKIDRLVKNEGVANIDALLSKALKFYEKHH